MAFTVTRVQLKGALMPVQPLTIIRPDLDQELDQRSETEPPYHVFLWNDPVTPMQVVTRALKQIFGFSAEKSQQLMLTAHVEGKAVVFTGAHDEAESYCVKLHAAGLMATIGKDQ